VVQGVPAGDGPRPRGFDTCETHRGLAGAFEVSHESPETRWNQPRSRAQARVRNHRTLLSVEAPAKAGKDSERRFGPRLCHPFAGLGERGASIRPSISTEASTSIAERAGDEKRPSNRQRSRGIHPAGFGRRSTGKPGRAMLTKRRLAKARKGPSHPPKGAIPGEPSRGMGSESAKAFRSPRVASTATPFTWSSGAQRGEVEGDARSGSVPTNIVECKKPREQVGRIRAKDLLSSLEHESPGLRARRNAPRDLGVEVARKRWSPPGNGDHELLPAWGRSSDFRVASTSARLLLIALTGERRPDLTTKPSKSGRPFETCFARRALQPIMNGGGGPAGPSRSPLRTVHTDANGTRAERFEGRSSSSIRRSSMGADEHLSFADWVAKHLAGACGSLQATASRAGDLDVDSVGPSPRPYGKGVGSTCSSGARCLHSERLRASRVGMSDEGQTGFRARTSRVRAASVVCIRVAQSIACAESSLTQV